MRTWWPIPAFLLAAAPGIAGGSLQRSHGAGSEPGLTLTHVSAALLVFAVAASAAWLIARRTGCRALITATDGLTTFPIAGPYATAREARIDLPRVREQFDPAGRYRWDVATTSDETVVGVANAECRPRSAHVPGGA